MFFFGVDPSGGHRHLIVSSWLFWRCLWSLDSLDVIWLLQVGMLWYCDSWPRYLSPIVTWAFEVIIIRSFGKITGFLGPNSCFHLLQLASIHLSPDQPSEEQLPHGCVPIPACHEWTRTSIRTAVQRISLVALQNRLAHQGVAWNWACKRTGEDNHDQSC